MTQPAPNAPLAASHWLPRGDSSNTGSPAADGGNALPILASDALLLGQAAVLIEHLGQHYRLQATRQGKLILTK